ncbi:MAG: hypothetical protein EXS14_10595 [Planctomycetes bacterium]|nr:hypothetical protein [Planctomycetota bacterium]
MKSLTALLLLMFCGGLAAQGETVYFSTRFTECPASGRAGDQNSLTAPCGPQLFFGTQFIIESAIANSPGISYVQPGVLNATVPLSLPANVVTDYVEMINFPQFNILIGDLDADGIMDESTNFPGVDAIWIPTAANGRPNTIHEMFVSSHTDSVGASGFIGVNITEADMVMLPRAPNVYPMPSTPAAPVFFVRQSHWEAFFGLLAPNNTIDVDAFAVDQSNGDIYVSFDGTVGIPLAMVKIAPATAAVAITITRGDIIRIPGTAYTPVGPYSIVSAPLSGFAERIYTALDAKNMVLAAGGNPGTATVPNVYSLDMDLSNATVNASSGFSAPALYFTMDVSGGAAIGPAITSAPAIYSSLGGGTFAQLNGITMSNAAASGMRNLSFNPAFWAGPLDALDVVMHTPVLPATLGRPLHLDAYPTNALLSTNALSWSGRITGYISNASPGAQIAIFGRIDVVPAGGWISRYDVSPYGVLGYPDLYVDPFGIADPACVLAPASPPFNTGCQIPFLQAVFNGGMNPITTWTDPQNGMNNGDSCFDLDLTLLVPPGTLPMSPPPVIVFQALDMSSFRLSTPMSFQFN